MRASQIVRRRDMRRNAADLFDEIARDGARVMACSARNYMYGFGALENLGRGRPKRGLEQVSASDSLLECVGNGAGLLVDFLQHEVAILPLLRRIRG